MASPFAAFRKYQAYLLAFFGVAIILVFAIGDQLMQWSRDQRQEDPLAVTFQGGKLTRGQLNQQIYERKFAAGILLQLRLSGIYASASPEERAQTSFEKFRNDVMSNPFQMRMFQRGLVLDAESVTAETTVRTLLLARKAEELGIMVSPKEVWNYLLKDVGLDKIREAEIVQMIEGPKEERSNRTVASVLEPIRRQMLANRLTDYLESGLEAMPPAEQFAYFCRLNQKIRAEVIALPVDQFLGSVIEPTEADLTAYFDRFKDKLPGTEMIGKTPLPSPEPGFMAPHRVKVQYLKARIDDFADASRSKVTDAEIAEFYERNKGFDPELQEDPLPLLDLDKDGAAKPGKQGDTRPTGQPSGSIPAKTNEKQTDTGPVGQPTGSAPAKGNESTTAPPESAAPPQPTSATKTPTIGLATAVSGVAANEGSLAQPAGPATGAATQGSGAPLSTTAAAQGSGVATLPAAQGTGIATFPSVQGTGIATLPAAQGTGSIAGVERTRKPKPLSEVKEYIQRKVAEQKAREAIDKEFAKTKEAALKHRNVRMLREADRRPPLRDLSDFTEDKKLTLHTTGLLTKEQLKSETDIGQSYIPPPIPKSFADLQKKRQNFEDVVFADKGELSLHQVQTTTDDNHDEYLSWKLEDVGEQVPALEGDARAEVVKNWKRGAGMTEAEYADKAIGKAEEEAKRLAALVGKGVSMEEAVKTAPGARLIKTDAFSWLTHGETTSHTEVPQSAATISHIDNIVAPGPEFMKTAFSLKPGEVGVAMNHPKSYVYVIKVTGRDFTPGVLVDNFVAKMDKNVWQGAGPEAPSELFWADDVLQAELKKALDEKLAKDFDLSWKIPARTIDKARD